MPGCPTERPRSIGVTSILAALAPKSVAAPRLLADPLPPGHPTCHARALRAAELRCPRGSTRRRHRARAHRARSCGRTQMARAEQFDDTPVVSATLRVRLRGDRVTHSAHLTCIEGDEGSLVCTSALPARAGARSPSRSAARSRAAAGSSGPLGRRAVADPGRDSGLELHRRATQGRGGLSRARERDALSRPRRRGAPQKNALPAWGLAAARLRCAKRERAEWLAGTKQKWPQPTNR
jgi:hypothetical protein